MLDIIEKKAEENVAVKLLKEMRYVLGENVIYRTIVDFGVLLMIFL